MTHLTINKKQFFCGSILLTIFSAIIFISCRKNESHLPENKFDAPAAKEWFYATFKKTSAYAAAAATGKQLPKWETGRYKKTGNIEMVEYDLVQQKKATMVTPTGNPFEDKRIADAAINRALFVKKGNETRLYTVQFIPAMDYAKARNYDISAISFIRPDNNFTGELLIRNWNNELVRGYTINSGKKTGVITQIRKEAAAARTPNSSECEDIYHYLLIQWCDYEPVGDNITLVSCGDWSILSESMTTSNCPMSSAECEQLGVDQEACLCQMLGICGGGGEDCGTAEERLLAIHATHQVDNYLEEHTSTILPNNEWEEHYKWRIYKVSWPCTKAIYSNEKAIVMTNGTTVPTLPANARIYKSFTHGALSTSGTTFGYVLSHQESNNYVKVEYQSALVKVWFDVTTEVACAGSPFSTTSEELAKRTFIP